MWLLGQEDTQRLRKLLNFRGIFITGETDIDRLFRYHHKFLGFSKISPIDPAWRASGYGDYFAWQGNKRKRVELELFGIAFFGHKPEIRQEIDILVAGHFPSRRKSQHWMEIKEKQLIDLSQWFDLKIIPPSQQILLLSHMNEMNYDGEEQESFGNVRVLEAWLKPNNEEKENLLVEIEEVLQSLRCVT